MSTLNDVLEKKGREVFTVSPDEPILNVIHRMTEKSIGTAVVLERDKLAGIFSERDFIRKVVADGKAPETIRVGDIMTRRVFFARPESTVEDCMQLMISEHIRHCPVMNDSRLAGIVSIGDLVKFKLGEQDAAIRDYRKYIFQSY